MQPPGAPHTWSTPDNSPPMGLWEPEKATAQFKGGPVMIGGSMPEEGKMPFGEQEPPSSINGGLFYDLPVQADYSPTTY